jgi:predicted DNA-binding transcriptional regulator YafY
MNGERLTVASVAAEGRFREDAVRRHLGALEAADLGVHREGSWGRAWYYRSPESEPSDEFNVLSLAVASTILSALRGSELDERLTRLTSRELVRAATDHSPGDLSRMFFAKSRMINPLGLLPDAVDRFAKAIFEQRVADLTYEYFDGEVSRLTIRPYTLVFSDEGLYVYAHCVQSDKTSMIDTNRLLSVERVRGMTISRERFLYPSREAYDPERLFRDCIGIFVPSEDSGPS